MYCRWRSSYQWLRVGIPLNGLASSKAWTWISNVICRGLLWIQGVEMRCDCSLYWYWWNLFDFDWFFVFLRHFQQYFSYIMATSFSGGRSRRMGKQLVNFITCGCESSAPFFVIYKAGRGPTPQYEIDDHHCWNCVFIKCYEKTEKFRTI